MRFLEHRQQSGNPVHHRWRAQLGMLLERSNGDRPKNGVEPFRQILELNHEAASCITTVSNLRSIPWGGLSFRPRRSHITPGFDEQLYHGRR